MIRPTRGFRLLPIGALALAGCGDATEPPAPRPAAVAVTPSSAEIPALGQTARVTVRRSKTDEKAEGAVLFVGSGAARALKAIRPADADPEARVFGLRTGHSISNRVRAAAQAAGLAGNCSGHSPRVGMTVDLIASGASLAAVQVAGRRRSARMPGLYARAELAGSGAVARYHQE